MFKQIWLTGVIVVFSIGLTACGGPSEAKIEKAQEKFAELVAIHNQTIEAHSEISGDYLEEDLVTLRGQVAAMQDYNLAELTEEEIDVIIEEMSSTIAQYNETIILLAKRKREEADAEQIEIPITIHNETGSEWRELYLFPTDEEQGPNLLNDTVFIGIGESLTGLRIYKDMDAKPWKLILSDGQENVREFKFEVDNLTEQGMTCYLEYDSETDRVSIVDLDSNVIMSEVGEEVDIDKKEE